MRVLITAGPTREYLDPVRFLTNASSGKMGYAVAAAARGAGHEVTLLSGPVALLVPGNESMQQGTTASALRGRGVGSASPRRKAGVR